MSKKTSPRSSSAAQKQQLRPDLAFDRWVIIVMSGLFLVIATLVIAYLLWGVFSVPAVESSGIQSLPTDVDVTLIR